MEIGSWPFFGDDEVESVVRVLASGNVNYWTGEQGKSFEEEFSSAVGCSYGVAVSNGTVAIELALIALGIGRGDEVIVTPYTFVASASAIVRVGAKPVFANIDPNSLNISPEGIGEAITRNTKAIVVVHLYGFPCEMDAILRSCQDHSVYLIEDCAQAHGSKYRELPTGSFGHVATFSFCQDKIMSTGGEGGMLVTNSEEVWEHAWSFKDHGKKIQLRDQKSEAGGFQWVHESIGTNWRMTEMQAAIGRVQLKKLHSWVMKRRSNAAILLEALRDIPAAILPELSNEYYHSYYKFVFRVRNQKLKSGWSRDKIISAIRDKGVACSSGVCGEVYLEEAFSNLDLTVDRLENAQYPSERTIQLLVHPTIAECDMLKMADVVSKVLLQASVQA